MVHTASATATARRQHSRRAGALATGVVVMLLAVISVATLRRYSANALGRPSAALPTSLVLQPASLRRQQQDAEKTAQSGEETAANSSAVAESETVEEQIARLKEILTVKQKRLRDFILANGVDNKTVIMEYKKDMDVAEKAYKELVIANTPPTPSPYEDGHGECVDGDCECEDSEEPCEGVYEWPDGGHYEGGFKNSSKHGFGTYANENSGTYSGDWANGRPHGEGVFVAKDNQWNYTGGYAKGMMEGQGKYTFRRCRWSMSDRETYCANKNRVVLYRGTAKYKGSLSECAGLAEKNEECGIELYYAGSSTAATSDCVCVKKGEECIKKPSKRTNHLYKYHCDGGTLSGGFKIGGPHGYAEWREANGAQFDGHYAAGAMVNGTYTWADGGQFTGPFFGKNPWWEKGEYIGSDGINYPNRTEDEANLKAKHDAELALQEEATEDEIAKLDAPKDEDINAIYCSFINKAEVGIELWWDEQKLQNIAPGGSTRMRTYLGHKWRMKKNGEVLKELTINPRAGAEQKMILELADLQQDAASSKPSAPKPSNTGGDETRKKVKKKQREVKELLNELKQGKTVSKDELRRRSSRILLAEPPALATHSRSQVWSSAADVPVSSATTSGSAFFGFNVRWPCSRVLPEIPWDGTL